MKYKSEICKVMHQDAMADFEVGAISKDRMKEYDKACLVQEPEASYTAINPPVSLREASKVALSG
jgi:DNA-binding transcriptional regulator YiaG